MGRYTHTLSAKQYIWILPRVPTRRCMCSSAHVCFHLTTVRAEILNSYAETFTETKHLNSNRANSNNNTTNNNNNS